MHERSLLFRNSNNSLFFAVRHENNVTFVLGREEKFALQKVTQDNSVLKFV